MIGLRWRTLLRRLGKCRGTIGTPTGAALLAREVNRRWRSSMLRAILTYDGS